MLSGCYLWSSVLALRKSAEIPTLLCKALAVFVNNHLLDFRFARNCIGAYYDSVLPLQFSKFFLREKDYTFQSFIHHLHTLKTHVTPLVEKAEKEDFEDFALIQEPRHGMASYLQKKKKKEKNAQGSI